MLQINPQRAILLFCTLIAPGCADLKAPAPAADTSKPYAVQRTMHIGGEGSWDWLTPDAIGKRIYLPRGTHTQILNAETGEVLGDLKDTAGVHAVALAPDINRGFTSNGKSNNVTIFDLKTLQPLGTIPVGEKPDAIVYDPTSKKVFAFNGKSENATAFDASIAPDAGKDATATIALNGKPEFAVSDGQGHVFVNLEDKSAITAIDTKSLKVTDTWKIEGGEEPSGLAIDLANHRLFAGCGGNNIMAVVDYQTGKTLGTAPIGKGVDACGFDPGTQEAFASCGDGTLTVIKETHPGKFDVTQTVETKKGARTMTLDPTTHTVYLPTAEFEERAPGQNRPAAKPNSFMLLVVARGH